jgi:predicted transcriptional regulator
MSKTISFSTDEATAEKLEQMATKDIRSASNFLTFLIVQEWSRRAESERITESWKAANSGSIETVKSEEVQ